MDRRALLVGALSAVAAPTAATAKIESVNPANNYYFPMAKYRYLPRILRAWIALDQLSPDALKASDWEGLEVVYERADTVITALPLYTSAVEGSRSTKRKKKSNAQKTMMKCQKNYGVAVADLGKAVQRKDLKLATDAVERARSNLLVYREIAQIDKDDGGVVKLPEDEEYEGAGHAAAPLGYVVPALRGGGMRKGDVRAHADQPRIVSSCVTVLRNGGTHGRNLFFSSPLYTPLPLSLHPSPSLSLRSRNSVTRFRPTPRQYSLKK
jgi:hypothetical protein